MLTTLLILMLTQGGVLLGLLQGLLSPRGPNRREREELRRIILEADRRLADPHELDAAKGRWYRIRTEAELRLRG